MKLNDRSGQIIIALICLVYFLLRVWNLTASCLWFDEIFGVHAGELDWANLFWFVAQDLIHPPLFYALLKIWISIGGASLFWLRFFPVFFSMLALIPFILLCRQLKLSLPAIALALTFFAANGSLIKYAQEVRMYSLLLCFGLSSMWLFARLLNSGKGFFLLIIANILLVYSHYFGWLIIASEILAVLILARERLKQISLMSITVALSFAPWIYAVGQAAKINSNVGQNIGWMNKPNPAAVFQFLFDLFEPVYFQNSSREPATILFITLPVIFIGLIIFCFYFADLKNHSAEETRNVSLLLIFSLAPILASFTLSWLLPYSIWGTRHLISVFAPLVILPAIAVMKNRFWQFRLASLSILFLLFGAALLYQAARPEQRYVWCAWETLAGYLPPAHSDSSEPTKIYVFEDLVAYHLWFELRDSKEKFQIVKVNEIEDLNKDEAYFLPRGFKEIQSTGNFEGGKFYIAYLGKNWNESKPPLANLKAQGYLFGEPKVFKAENLTAFLVEVRKEN